MIEVKHADVVVVRTPDVFGSVIRFGEKLQGKPDLRNHVAVLHHIDFRGVYWWLEGRPGGLGWRPEDPRLGKGYLSSRYTISNAAQPKTDAQRDEVCAAMRELVGKPYDWDAIEADAAQALHLPGLWQSWNGQMPGHVVCSSSAAWAYSESELAAPEFGGGRFTEPADWDSFIADEGWKSPVSG
jgi:hypothetical protein